MSRTARFWKGVGPVTLGGFLLSGALAWGDTSPNELSKQLLNLARQAESQGRVDAADAFFRKAIDLNPDNAEARTGLRLVALRQDQEEALPPQATLEAQDRLTQIREQQLTANIRQRIARARELVRAGEPDAALDTLRLAITALEAEDRVPDATVRNLRRQVEVEFLTTMRQQEEYEERLNLRLLRDAAAAQQTRALETLHTNEETISALMTQFHTLMAEGIFNVLETRGTGDIIENSRPFFDARLLAQQASALDPRATAPRAGYAVSQAIGFLSQTMGYELLKEFRYMQTLLDVDRASVPFPDTITIEYPPADWFREISEKRIARYESSDLVERSPQTLRIMEKLSQPISMPFDNETPLEDVLDYIKQATADSEMLNGIPIYVDPVGLLEADRTMQSTVTMDLEGVPLKTTLRLMLNQLELTHTVKDGLLTITSKDATDTPTEIRVYPVADLAIIPMSLMGMGGGMMGGGMGGMGGGMMGGGMGGMGGGMMGGMGGMGGGMGMGGMGGGMMSVPVAPQEPATSPYLEKKRN